MRGALIIAGKDIRNIFASPLFYVLSGLCTVAWSFLFIFSLSEFVNRSFMSMSQGGGENESIHFTVFARHISLVNLLMIFAVSALTMRLFTEEKRNRTMDLLLTSPVTATEIAVGKLIAGIVTAWALVLVSFLYPASMALFGKLDWGPLLSSYVGLLLLTATYTSIGMFASSLTENSVVAVIVALIANVMLWFVGAAAETSDSSNGREFLEHLNVASHFVNFIKGNMTLAGIVFFSSVIFLFAFLTQRVIESSRWR